MARAALRLGDLVRLSAAGLRVNVAPRLTRQHVLKLEARLADAVYGRPAFSVSCGAEHLVVWASHVKLLRPRKREREPLEDEEETD